MIIEPDKDTAENNTGTQNESGEPGVSPFKVLLNVFTKSNLNIYLCFFSGKLCSFN